MVFFPNPFFLDGKLNILHPLSCNGKKNLFIGAQKRTCCSWCLIHTQCSCLAVNVSFHSLPCLGTCACVNIKYFYVAKCVWHLAENNNCRNTLRFKCHNELYRLHDHCQTQTVCQICFAKRLASWEGIGYCHSLFQMPRRRKQSPPPPPNLSTRPKRSRRLTQKARSALTDEEPVSQPPNPQIINAFPVPDNVEPLLPQQSGETSHTSTNSDPLLVALLEEVRRQGRAIQALQTQRNEPPPPIVPPPAPAGQPPTAQATLNVLQAQPTPAAVQPSSAALATVNTLTSAAAHSALGQLSTTTLATANAQPVVHPSPADKVSGVTDEAQGLSGSDTIFSGVRVQLQPDSRTLITAGMPLGHLLSAKIKQDIWDDKFVDMAALLYPDTHTSSYGVQFAGDLASEQGHGELRFAPRKKVITINDWVKAFQIYMAVYIQKPGREACAPELLTYMAEIQSIAEDGLDWALYDDQYRRDRASNLSPPPWSAVNQPLHNVIMRKRNSGMPPGQAQQKPSTGNFCNNHNTSSIPVGFCYAYHSRTRRCEKVNCPFKHQCFTCNHPRHHPVFTCRPRPSSSPHNQYSNQQNTFRRPFANTYRYWSLVQPPWWLWPQQSQVSGKRVQWRFPYYVWKKPRRFEVVGF